MSASSRFDNPYCAIDHTILNQGGLNMQAVFSVTGLPAGLQQKLAAADPAASPHRQLLLIGNGGETFWQRSREFVARTGHPLDEFALDTVQRFLAEVAPGVRYRVLYPGPSLIPLQTLGALAGWHHPSPMMVGINDYWGMWYAYRVALVADTDFTPSARVDSVSPCLTCADKPCLAACPAGALGLADGLRLERCLDHRVAPASSCAACSSSCAAASTTSTRDTPSRSSSTSARSRARPRVATARTTSSASRPSSSSS